MRSLKILRNLKIFFVLVVILAGVVSAYVAYDPYRPQEDEVFELNLRALAVGGGEGEDEDEGEGGQGEGGEGGDQGEGGEGGEQGEGGEGGDQGEGGITQGSLGGVDYLCDENDFCVFKDYRKKFLVSGCKYDQKQLCVVQKNDLKLPGFSISF